MYDIAVFDFDDTIYDYERANHFALESTFAKLSSEQGISTENIKLTYSKIRNEIMTSNNPVKRHNKLVYFLELGNYLKFSLDTTLTIYQHYQECFLKKIEPYEGFIEFIHILKEKGIHIVILSNNTIQNTIDKIRALNITKYIDKCITSDIISFEKPHREIYHYLEQYIKQNGYQKPIIIGDNFKNDIEPLLNSNYLLFHKSGNQLSKFEKYYEFSHYKNILDYFKADLF